MFIRSPLALAVLLALAATGASAQSATHAEAAKAAVQAAARNETVASYCYKVAAATDTTAMVIKVEELPASVFSPGAGPATTMTPVKVGSFTYKGHGIRITSDDPRFAELKVDPVSLWLSLPNGHSLATANLLQSRGAGQCRLELITSPPPRVINGPPDEARADLPGYRVMSPTSYFAGSRYIGLMQPEGNDSRTAVASFTRRPPHDTRIEAEMPLALQGIKGWAPVHFGSWSATLIGRQPDGSIVHFSLEAAT